MKLYKTSYHEKDSRQWLYHYWAAASAAAASAAFCLAHPEQAEVGFEIELYAEITVVNGQEKASA